MENPFDSIKGFEIEIQLPGIDIARLRKFAGRFGCSVTKGSSSGYFKVLTDDPINFYWLGANMNNAVLNKQNPSNISAYIEI